MYKHYLLQRKIDVHSLISSAEVTLPDDYVFEGECHSFWECIYVESGKVGILKDGKEYELSENDITFNRPMESHSIWAKAKSSPKLITIAFSAYGLDKTSLGKDVFKLDEKSCALLRNVNNIVQQSLVEKSKWEISVTNQQLISNKIEALILHVLSKTEDSEQASVSIYAQHYQNILNVMKEHIGERLTIKNFVELTMMSESNMKKCFKKYSGMGVMEYFNQLKLLQAIKLLNEGFSCSDICARLGYSSLSYFSSCFKKQYGFSPQSYKYNKTKKHNYLRSTYSMYSKNNVINNEIFKQHFRISDKKLKKAVDNALGRLGRDLERFSTKLPRPVSGYNPENQKGISNNRYVGTDELSWKAGMYVGICWLAYLLTKDKKYCSFATNHTKKFIALSQQPESLKDHDTGFKFTPTCVACYKITGDKEAKKAALAAADILMDHICPYNKFIIRAGTRSKEDHYDYYRIVADSMLNIPLLFWATTVTGDEKYKNAAIDHYLATAEYIIRQDGSSFHHYQFDPETLQPVKGVTWQGYSDKSCWARGQAWLVYGYPVAYKYTGREEIVEIQKAVSYYFLDNLPSDIIPYWDFVFTEGSFEPRDSSASAIAACGLLEMSKYFPEGSEEKAIYLNGAHRMIDALIDHCENESEDEDGFIHHVTHAKPVNSNVDGIEVYGDYFYFEALVRLVREDIEIFW